MSRYLAIDGGVPAVTAPIPAWPVHGERERELLLDVLESGHWGTLSGSRTEEFAAAFARFQGAAHAVCTPNGTLALEAALEALGVGPGDEVITSAWTFIATAGAILTLGARPVFVDIDPTTNTIDPARIEAALTPKTRAIVPVHIGGLPADMDGVMEVASRAGLPVLEDACQAWGAAWKGRGAGTIGDLGCFSFQESKNITAGEGGAVVTDNGELHDRVWAIHNTGRNPERPGLFDFAMIGRNLRMTEWQAAILLAQLERLPAQMDRRDRAAARLTGALAESPGLTPLRIDPRVTRCAWHLYQLRYDPAAFGGRDRATFLAALAAEGVPASAGYMPLPRVAAVRAAIRDRFGADASDQPVPHADAAGESTVWLPQTLLLGDDDLIDQVIAAFYKIGRAWQR
jgi:dTDP-4-amino-4,6-dideoxygalactose transaminase